MHAPVHHNMEHAASVSDMRSSSSQSAPVDTSKPILSSANLPSLHDIHSASACAISTRVTSALFSPIALTSTSPLIPWTEVGRTGYETSTGHPVEIIAVSSENQLQPAVLLNSNLISDFQKASNLKRERENAEKVLKANEGPLENKLRWAKAHFESTKSRLDSMKMQFSKEVGGPSVVQKKELIQLNKKCKEAMVTQKALQKEKATMEGTAHNAELNYYQLLEEIQGTLMTKLGNAGLVREKAPLPLDEAASEIPSLAILRTNEAPIGRMEDYQTLDQIPGSDKLEKILKAADAKQEQRKRFKDAQDAYQHHRETYHEQIQNYAYQQGKEVDEVESEFGPVFVQRTIEAIQKIKQAENAQNTANDTAKYVGVPNADDQQSNFASVSGEGYDDQYHKECVQSANIGGIYKWLDGVDQGKRRKIDKEEAAFTFQLKSVNAFDDNLSDIEASPKVRTKINNWRQRCETLGKKMLEKRRGWKRSKSIDVVQAVPKREDDPGFSSDRPAWNPIRSPSPDAHIPATNLVVIQAEPNSWEKASASSKQYPGELLEDE